MLHRERFSELDWLRVVLIFAVFLHHVFMPFNGDDWHVVNADSSKLLDDLMVYFEQLRLQTLFFIAGAGSTLLLHKSGAKAFLTNKFYRLFIPLLAGIFLIVPPQNYFENIHEYDSFLSAYLASWASLETNHLWFVEFLIVFMVLAVPVQRLVESRPGEKLIRVMENLVSLKHGLFSFVILLAAIRCSLKLVFPSQESDIENPSVAAFFLFFFLAGMCFMHSQAVWQVIAIQRKTNLKWFVASTAIFYAYYFPDYSGFLPLEVRWSLWWAVCSLVSWSGLLAFMGYASTYCKTAPGWLRDANELIYPFYIFHQSVIVVFAFYITQWQSGIAVKSVSLLITSLLCCVMICYCFVKPFNLTRFLFGLKPKGDARNPALETVATSSQQRK